MLRDYSQVVASIIILHIFICYLCGWRQIGHKNRLDEKRPLSAEEVVAIVKDVFVIATERDIYTGDSVEIKVLRKGVQPVTEVFALKTD